MNLRFSMAFPAQEITGTILYRIETGEHHLRFMVFSAAGGLQPVLMRKVRKRRAAPLPDLFDEVEFALQVGNTNGIPFVREHRVLRKRTQLSSKHERFVAASGIAKFYLDNGSHLLEPEKFAHLLVSSLDALKEGGNCLVVRFKMLYVFAREEGYPVKQSWLEGMDKNESDFAHGVLFRKISDQSPEEERVRASLVSLENWLESETVLLCGSS